MLSCCFGECQANGETFISQVDCVDPMAALYCSDCVFITQNEHVDLISSSDGCWCSSELTIVYHHCKLLSSHRQLSKEAWTFQETVFGGQGNGDFWTVSCRLALLKREVVNLTIKDQCDWHAQTALYNVLANIMVLHFNFLTGKTQ